MVNRHDINQTWSLIKSGKAEGDSEINMIRQMLDYIQADTKIFVDVGANIGTHSFAVARHLADAGRVYSFEPQRLLFQIICGTMALNSVTNVYCYNAAVGAAAGELAVPQFDYFKPMNFGSVEFGENQIEKLDQERGNDPEKVEYVPVVTIDSVRLPGVHVLKIDAEGMEFEVLAGARETILRFTPILIVEFFKVDFNKLGHKLEEMGYRVYIHDIVFICIPQRYGHILLKGFSEFVPRA